MRKSNRNLRTFALGLVALVAALAPGVASAAALPPLKSATLVMRTGQRVSYLAASATVGRSGINLVPDANGNWVDINSHNAFPEGAGTGGGAGIEVFDICSATATSIVAAETTYLLNTVTNSVTLASRSVFTGNGQTLDSIWARPANFAAYPDQNVPNFRVKRLTYTLDGRAFRAIRIQQNTGNGWTQSTYDLTSGFLIISSQAVQIQGGGTGLATFRITSGKLLNGGFPGVNTAFPASLKKWKTYNYLAKGSGGVFNSGSVTGQVPFRYSNMKWGSQVLSADVSVNGKAQGKIQFVAGTFASPWMNPALLKSFKTNQEVDAEPALQYRIYVSSQDSSSVVIRFTNKSQNVYYKYNKNSGDLVSFSVSSVEGIFGSAATITFVSRS